VLDCLVELSGICFEVNEVTYPQYYLLANVIYPQWSCVVQSIHKPQDENGSTEQKCRRQQGKTFRGVLMYCNPNLLPFKTHCKKVQKAVWKDIAKCFSILQSPFAIIQDPRKLWQMDTIPNITIPCVILHNHDN